MTSLSEAYGGGVRTVVDRRRRLLATALFAAGLVMVTAAVALATTGLRSQFGYGVLEARELAGVLAGLGLPAAVVGIFAALPATDETRAAAAIGASTAVFGVLVFVYAYPARWLENEPALALATVGIYTLGMLVSFWSLFIAVATFKARNDPGGTARVEVTDEGKIRFVSTGSDDASEPSGSLPLGLGGSGIGLVGRDPDGEVPTQTNVSGGEIDDEARATTVESDGDPETRDPTARDPQEAPTGSTDGRSSPPTGGPTPTSDGGPSVASDSRPGGLDSGADQGQPDPYCGNCQYFEYVDMAGDLDPYCGFHQEFMEDLEPCEEWTANTDRE